MNETYIKLYRKATENGMMKDHLAWVLFSWLLLNVDFKTGKIKLGRYKIADALGINPNTYYKVLRRLQQKWGVIDITVTKEWSEVWIVNWGKYQHTQSPSDKAQAITVKLTDNQSNTIQEVKNKRIKDKSFGDESPKTLVIRKDPGVDKILVLFEEHVGHIPSDKKPRNVAHNIKQIIGTFIKENGEMYFKLRGSPLTQDYVIEKSWEWYRQKDYCETTEKLETFKLKMRVFLDDISKRLKEEAKAYESTTIN